jgi:OmpA-OmpF porin, OOP family
MAANLLTLLQSEFSSDAISRLASLLGEPETKTQAAVGAAVPAVLGALSQKVSAPTGAADVLGMIQRGGLDGTVLQSLASLWSQGKSITDLTRTGAPLVASLFGTQQAGVVDWISSSSGMNRASVASLLSLLVPFVMNWIAKQTSATGGLTPASLTGLLGGQPSWLASLPAGLTSALGLGLIDRPTPVRPEVATPAPARSGMGWLKWAIPLVALFAVVAGVRTCSTGESENAAVGTTGTTAYGLGPFVDRTLPGGISIHIPENGVEAKLISFITDAGRPVDKTSWFSFDRLEFETGSATLKPSSQEQLSNIAAILKAYPSAAVKIGGYTDNTGDQAANLRLSQSRADNTMNAIGALGVPSSRLAAEGYGDQHPVASNDTEEGRQRNRRVDILVTGK